MARSPPGTLDRRARAGQRGDGPLIDGCDVGGQYAAEATFAVPDDGSIDLAEDRPLRGDWVTPGSGVALAALVADDSMSPDDWYEPQTLHVEVVDVDGTLTAADIQRPGVAPGVTSEPLDVDGLTGSWRLPADWDPAADDRPGIDTEQVVTFGNSRGAEPALGLAAEDPDLVRGAIAPVALRLTSIPSPGPSFLLAARLMKSGTRAGSSRQSLTVLTRAPRSASGRHSPNVRGIRSRSRRTRRCLLPTSRIA